MDHIADLGSESTACFVVHKASVNTLDPVNLHTNTVFDNGEALLPLRYIWVGRHLQGTLNIRCDKLLSQDAMRMQSVA